MLDTNEKIEEALRGVAPDQVGVIQEMALHRDYQLSELTPTLYQKLIREEASYSLDEFANDKVPSLDEDRANAQEYSDALNDIADRIQG